ncbi:MAG: hypothetical protein IMZ55_13995 [Acidobacteria bacterium]|nr:hypothetical protein [Acidobacteriota bacterium]
MSCPNDYAVQGPDRGHEIPELAPIGQQNKRFPNRAPAGAKRRKGQGGRAGDGPDRKTATDDPEAAPNEAAAGGPRPQAADDDEHMIDALA